MADKPTVGDLALLSIAAIASVYISWKLANRLGKTMDSFLVRSDR